MYFDIRVVNVAENYILLQGKVYRIYTKNETIKVIKLKRIYRICRFGSVMCGVSIITLVIVAVL